MHDEPVGDERAGDRLGEVENLPAALVGEGLDAIEISAVCRGEFVCRVKLLEFFARQEADMFCETAQAA